MSDILPDEQLAEIQARAEAAPSGPWRVERDEPSLTRFVTNDDGTLHVSLGYVGNRTQGEGEFIAHARTDVPALLAHIAALAAEVQRLRLSEHERAVLRFALEVADDVIASNPADFTSDDQTAMEKLQAMAAEAGDPQ